MLPRLSSARTATQALNNVTHRWTTLLAEHGLAEASRQQPDLLSGVNCTGGKLTCTPVAEAHQIPVFNAAEVLEL